MRKLSSLLVIITLVALTATPVGCASSSTATDRTPLEIAKLTYADASLAYEFTMVTVKAAADAGRLPAPLWARAYAAQTAVQLYAPQVRAAINLWESSGVKPASIDEALAKLSAASAEIRAVKVGIQ